MRPWVLVEQLSVVGFLGVAVWAAWSKPPPLPPIDVAALATGPAEERWAGIFLGEHHVGYAVSREAPAANGGRVFQQQSMFRLQALGTIQDVAMGGSAVVGADGALERFEFLLSSPAQLHAVGRVAGNDLQVALTQAGETRDLHFTLDAPPVTDLTLPAQLRGRTLEPGQRFEVPYFHPLTLSNQQAVLTVERAEMLPNGDVGWWVATEAGGITTRRLVDEQGDTLREESPTGMRLVRMTREQALTLDEGDPPDLVATTAVPVTEEVPDDTRRVRLRVSGVAASRFANDAPLQVVDGDTIQTDVPLLAELPVLPVRGSDHLEATPSLPADHPEIIARARAVVADAPDRLEAVRRIHRFVHDHLRKEPTIGVPNGLEVLRSGRGDCNEHTALFVSLARAAGIPARIAAGLVYSSRVLDQPGFYYHAWPEVDLGRWVPVDPTLDQLPADATHLKVVNGDLDRQVEIMGLLGQVQLAVLDAR